MWKVLNFISCKIKTFLPGKNVNSAFECVTEKCVVGSSSISIFHLLSFIHIYSKLSILKNQHANTHSIFAHAVWVKIFFVNFFLFWDLKWVTKLSVFWGFFIEKKNIVSLSGQHFVLCYLNILLMDQMDPDFCCWWS